MSPVNAPVEPVSDHDRDILRRLAEAHVRLSEDPVNVERHEAWYRHDEGPGGRPMILAEVGGVRDDVHWTQSWTLECEGEWARRRENALRAEHYLFHVLKDDHVILPTFEVPRHIVVSDYGVKAEQQHGHAEGVNLGARRWDPPIKDLDADFDKLHPRTYSVDRDAAQAEFDAMRDLFGDILDVRFRGQYWWTMGLTWWAIDLIGLENLMIFMFDDPDGLHRLMRFLADDHIAFAKWLEEEELLFLNNEKDYIGSGSRGFTRRLPQPDKKPEDPVRLKDLWVLSESQETVGVGPAQFEEFIFPYQKDVTDHFGLVYYGCCEPVDNRYHVIRRMENLSRISVSPWADETVMADACRRDGVVYSRKPNPTQVSTEKWDEDAIRADLRKTLETARGCQLEIVMKDVHTLCNQPDRLPRWVQLARETVDEVWG